MMEKLGIHCMVLLLSLVAVLLPETRVGRATWRAKVKAGCLS
jgi:hypothetical protein